MNNVDRQDKPPNSKRGLSENVYAMFGGNAMSQKAKSCLLCSTMLTFSLTEGRIACSRQPSYVAAVSVTCPSTVVKTLSSMVIVLKMAAEVATAAWAP